MRELTDRAERLGGHHYFCPNFVLGCSAGRAPAAPPPRGSPRAAGARPRPAPALPTPARRHVPRLRPPRSRILARPLVGLAGAGRARGRGRLWLLTQDSASGPTPHTG